jgi:ribosomal-protein-serine acetyltransferase
MDIKWQYKNYNLELQIPSLDLLNEHFELVMKNKERIGEFLAWARNYESVKDSKSWISASIENAQSRSKFEFVLLSDEKLIGAAGYNGIEDNIGEIGYWIDEEYEGKGIIRSAVEELIRFGYDELKVKTIRIQAQTKNLRSNAIPISLGFNLTRTVMDETEVEFNIYELSR